MDCKEALKNELITSFFETVDTILNTTSVPRGGDKFSVRQRGDAESIQSLMKHVYNEYHGKITMPEMRVIFYPNGVYSVQVFEKKEI